MKEHAMARRVGVTFSNEKKVAPYEEALRAVGLEPVRLHAEGTHTLDGLDGLLVSGGADVDPALYQQRPHPETDQPDTERDQMEKSLLDQALKRDLPVLCICRGMQLFNVMHDGTLIQHLEAAAIHRQRGVDQAHLISVEPGSRLAEIVGEGEYWVNSRHHQAVDQVVDPRLSVSARSTDGVIEGLERRDRRFAIAVQWHPEDRVATSLCDRRLFEAFARALDRS